MAAADSDLIKKHRNNMEADAVTGLVTLPRITAQQRYYVAARVGGLSRTAAAKEVGVSANTAANWERLPDIQQHMDHYLEEFSAKVLPRIQFGIEQAHQMYMNAYHSSGTSAEMTRATDSLVKLHKLLDTPDGERQAPTSVKQLESLDTAQLLKYAAIGLDTLHPGGEVLDGEYTEEE